MEAALAGMYSVATMLHTAKLALRVSRDEQHTHLAGSTLPQELLLQTVLAVLLLLDVCQAALPISGSIPQSLVAQRQQPPQKLSLVLSIRQLRLQL